MLRYLFLVLTLLISAGSASSQAKEITKDEFSTQYYAALDKGQSVPRRQTSREEHYQGNKIDQVQSWIYEYLPPYRHRIVYEKSAGSSSSRIEELRVEADTYCRSDSKPWAKSSGLCIQGFIRTTTQAAFQVTGKVSSEYTVERASVNGQALMVYREYTKYKYTSPTNLDPEKLWFAENKYWLNPDGLIVKQEIKIGVIGSPLIKSDWVDTYDYNPSNLQIEPPIK